MDRGAWQVIVHRLAKSPTGLSDWYYRKQSTAQKTITPATKTWDYLKRVLLFPGGSLSESCSAVSDQSLSGSSVHGIPQARILQWVTIPFSRRTFARNWAWVYHTESRLSHQGNYNQPKNKKKKKKTCLPISEARVPSLGSKKSGSFICSAMSNRPSCLRLKNPIVVLWILGFPCVSAGKEFAYNAGDLGSIPGLGRSQQKGKANHSSILVWKIPGTA